MAANVYVCLLPCYAPDRSELTACQSALLTRCVCVCSDVRNKGEKSKVSNPSNELLPPQPNRQAVPR